MYAMGNAVYEALMVCVYMHIDFERAVENFLFTMASFPHYIVKGYG